MVATTNTQRTSFTIRPWLVVTILCVLYLSFLYVRYGNGIREFVWPTPAGEKGYDGQFTYYIALDPLNPTPDRFDVRAYRYQRILHPLLARLLSLGQEPLIGWAMLAINVVMLVVGTAALEQLLIIERVSRRYALTYGLFGGVFAATRAGTTEPLAYGLVLLAILIERREHYIWQSVLLALAALAKETTLFFTVGYLLYYLIERRWLNAIRLALIAVAPFIIWQIVLKLWLGEFGVGSGGADATPFTLIPFGGLWQTLFTGGVFILLGLIMLLFAMLPTVWGLIRSGRDIMKRKRHPYVFLLFANAAIMPFVPFSTYREPFGIARFLVGLVIALVLYAAWRKTRKALTYSTLWPLLGLLLLG